MLLLLLLLDIVKHYNIRENNATLLEDVFSIKIFTHIELKEIYLIFLCETYWSPISILPFFNLHKQKYAENFIKVWWDYPVQSRKIKVAGDIDAECDLPFIFWQSKSAIKASVIGATQSFIRFTPTFIRYYDTTVYLPVNSPKIGS